MDRDDGPAISVQVVYCPSPLEIDESAVRLPVGALLKEALAASGLLLRHAGLEANAGGSLMQCGIWGHARPLDHALRDGDRVEVYRPLKVDPMEARRRRQKVQSR